MRCWRFQFSAALVSQHCDMVGKLTMLAMLYEPADGRQAVIAQLKVLTGGEAAVAVNAVWTLRRSAGSSNNPRHGLRAQGLCSHPPRMFSQRIRGCISEINIMTVLDQPALPSYISGMHLF
jgi:hypothetical protein